LTLSVGDIRSQIAAEWLQIAQRSQWRAYTTIALSNGAIADPYDLPFPQMGVPLSICPKMREWSYLRNVWSDTLHVWF